MFLFEAKKREHLHSYFGTLTDLMKEKRDQRHFGFGFGPPHSSQPKCYLGNYVLTLLNKEIGGNSVRILVMHHENADPNRITSMIQEKFEKNIRNDSNDSEPWPAHLNDMDVDELSGSDESMNADDGSFGTDVVASNNYLANLIQEAWFLQVGNGKRDHWHRRQYRRLFQKRSIGSSLFEDSECGAYALVLYDLESVKSAVKIPKLLVPMDEVLYETEYRGFSGDNPYYGLNDHGGFNFDRLPEKLFVKLLSYLPWHEQARCRRVSRVWTASGNKALSINTKAIDMGDPLYSKLKPDDVGRLLPIVADGLEILKLSGGGFSGGFYDGGLLAFNYQFIISSGDFRFLRQLDLDVTASPSLSYQTLMDILDKCPNVKELSLGLFPTTTMETLRSTTYGVEKLEFGGHPDFSDGDLMNIGGHFPKLASITLNDIGDITKIGLNSFTENYGGKLKRLVVIMPRDMGYRCWCSDSFTGIGSCKNLETLSVADTDLASDEFMAAMATGCNNLTTLCLSNTGTVTNGGLALLASLTNLKKLDISHTFAVLGDAITKIAVEGHLEQLLAKDVELPFDSLKAIIRYCPRIKLLDIRGHMTLTKENVIELAEFYGRFKHDTPLIIRSRSSIWKDDTVQPIMASIKERYGRHGRLIIDTRHHVDGFLQTDNESYQAMIMEDTDIYEQEEPFFGPPDVFDDDYDYDLDDYPGYDGDDDYDHYEYGYNFFRY